MNKIYTDNPDNAESLNLGLNIFNIENYDGDVNSLFLIFNKNFEIKGILDKGFIVTFFPSDFSDFEIPEKKPEFIRKKLNLFISLISNSNIKTSKDDKFDSKTDKLSLDISEKTENSSEKVIIEENTTFKGVYINGILVKKGNIRFIPVYEVILYFFKEKFNGKLTITQKNSRIYTADFYNGELSGIDSFREDDNFQFFLKKYGYISEVNRDVYLYPVEKQLSIYVAGNDIFKHEKGIILKDYFSFLFRNIISLNSGDFEITDDYSKKSVVFNDYLGFLYNFVNYLKNKLKLPEHLSISDDLSLTFSQLNEEAKNILTEVKNGKSVSDIQAFFDKYDKTYIINVLYFFKILGVIEENKKSDSFKVSSNSISENISQRVKIWMDKIKKENYFTLLGININDNDQYIEEKFRNLFSQFSTYLSSEELRKKYKNDLEDIIFELESAYHVVKNRELREKYYKKMLK